MATPEALVPADALDIRAREAGLATLQQLAHQVVVGMDQTAILDRPQAGGLQRVIQVAAQLGQGWTTLDAQGLEHAAKLLVGGESEVRAPGSADRSRSRPGTACGEPAP